MEFREFKAKTVSEAITEASIALGAASDMIEYEVIEEGGSRLLGLFSKDAVIRARLKEAAEEETIEKIKISLKAESKPAPKTEKKAEKKPEENPTAKAEKKEEIKAFRPEQKSAPKKEVKAEKKAESKPAPKAEKKTETKPEVKAAKEKCEPYNGAGEADIKNVLGIIFEKLGITASYQITVDEAEKVVNINVEGEDTGDIIGKRGQTLDAIQYLVSIIINKNQDGYYRVKLDTNDYRDRRQKTLENLAKNIASKVKKTKKKVALEPMNPYERRIIHSYLQADKFVTTKSEGEEPNRRVVVYYKKS